MAQTTHRVLFWPILVVATFPKPPHRIFCKYNLLYIVVSVIVVKKDEELTKNNLNDTRHVVQACLSRHYLP